MISIGLDVGGTKVLGVAIDVDEPATVLGERRVPTPDGGEGLVEVLLGVVDSLSGRDEVVGVGVGVPGLVDRSGRLHMGPHLRHVQDLPLADVLAARVGTPVVVDNDANCAAVGEQACGAAAGHDEALVITLGTGIGAGIITGGRLLRGAVGYAGEPGHMAVVPGGESCVCGQRGCWEQYASGSAVARLARAAAADGRLDGVLGQVEGRAEAIHGELVVAAARAGDAEAMAVVHELAHWVAVGLANLVNVLDPGVVVIGGGLVDAADVLLPEVRRRFDELVMGGGLRPTIPIMAATLGERSGAIGAGVLAQPGWATR